MELMETGAVQHFSLACCSTYWLHALPPAVQAFARYTTECLPGASLTREMLPT